MSQKMAIPYLFRCPISLDLFKDPVTLSTGQTYERSSIEKWLATGNLTCPVTMQKLQDLSLVPNHTLRHLINQWLQMGQQCGQDRVRATLTDPDRSLAALKHTLESNDSSFDDKLEAFEKIDVLCRDFPLKIPCLIQMEILSSLISLVFERRYEKSEFVEHALCCVLKLLPYGEMVCLNVLLEEQYFASFLAMFKQGSFKTKTRLCQLVEAISSSLETRELCAKLGQNRKFLRLIIHNFCGPDPNTDNAGIGIKTVSALSVLGSNRDSLVHDGAVDSFIAYIMYASSRMGCVSDGTDHNINFLKTRAMVALELLLGGASGKEALLNNPSGVKALVKMVFRVSNHDQGSESAVNALMIVCEESLKAREDGVCAGVLTQLLLLIQSQCNVRVKTKARMLLKLLRSMWIENPKLLV